MEHFINAFKKYADFTGRARRQEYWMFYLFYILIILVLSFIDGVTGTFDPENNIGLLSGLFILISFVPAIAIAARRLHDTNRSGWWQLVAIIPILGPIFLIILCVLKGNEGENKFGDNPLAVEVRN